MRSTNFAREDFGRELLRGAPSRFFYWDDIPGREPAKAGLGRWGDAAGGSPNDWRAEQAALDSP